MEPSLFVNFCLKNWKEDLALTLLHSLLHTRLVNGYEFQTFLLLYKPDSVVKNIVNLILE